MGAEQSSSIREKSVQIPPKVEFERDGASEDGSPARPTPARPTFTKSNEFWFQDGNIVVISGGIGYRVHQGILSLHSSVFSDMLVVGRPVEGTLGKRLATVTLPDPAKDVYRLLKALYFRLYATERPQNMEVLASLLRMATKYMVDNLRKEVIARLEILFPDTLEKYNSQDRKAVTPPDFDPIIAVELSLACDVPAILPAALYLSVLRENAHSLSIGLSKAVQMGSFPPHQAHYRCLCFKDEFNTFTESVITSFYSELPWGFQFKDRFRCVTNTEPCLGVPVHTKRALELRLSGLHHDMFLDSTFLSLSLGKGYQCPACVEKIKAYQSAIRSKVWETGLPGACGWQTWDDVKSGRPPTIKGATA